MPSQHCEKGYEKGGKGEKFFTKKNKKRYSLHLTRSCHTMLSTNTKEFGMESGIYRIVCLGNGKVYIGQSRDVASRIFRHKSDLRLKRHANPYLQNAWDMYGEINFIFEGIEKCEPEKLDEREKYYINLLCSHWTKGGFNMVEEPVWQDPAAIERTRIRMKNLWQDPEYRHKIVQKAKLKSQEHEYRKWNLKALEEGRSQESRIINLKKHNDWQDSDEEHKKSQAHHAKTGWADEEKRMSRIESIKRACGTEENRKKKSEQMKAQMQTPEMIALSKAHNDRQKNDPEYKKRHSEIVKDMWNDPEYRSKTSEASSAKWEDPALVAKQSEIITEKWQDPEYREKGCKAAKKRWENPEDRQKYIEAMKKRRQDPEYKAAQAAKVKAQWADPEFRAKRAEAIRLAKEKKKQ